MRRAFTLVEMIIVMIIIGVAAGLIVPRFRSNDVRMAEARGEEIAGLFEAAARRQTLSGRGSMVEFDGDEGTLSLYTRRTEAGRYQFSRSAEWLGDRLTRPVSLEGMELEEVLIGGRTPSDRDEWRVVFDPSGPRSEVRLVLRPVGGQASSTRWLVLMPTSGIDAEVRLLAQGESPSEHRETLRQVDLDAMGLGEVAW